MTLPLLLLTPAEALADSLHGLDQRIAAPLDEVPALRRAWADSLIERLQARGYALIPLSDVAPSAVGGTDG